MPSRKVEESELARHYAAMGESVDLINEIIATGDKDEESLDAISRNVKHLEIMVTQTYWTTENMSDVNAAITAGNAYIA